MQMIESICSLQRKDAAHKKRVDYALSFWTKGRENFSGSVIPFWGEIKETTLARLPRMKGV